MIVANGKNMIDGLNGLLILSSISMFLCLYKLSIIVGHSDLIYFSIIMIYFLSIILIFNYPIAKIFMGDTGAYFLGIICGISVIYFFGSNPEVLTWNAIVILFYPSFEVLFTILRRIFNNQNITSPDLDHNHNLLFRYIKKTKIKHPNSICTLFIFPQMLIPYFFIDYVFNDLVKVFILLSIQIFIYLSFHFIIKFLIKGRISLKQSI